MTGSLEDQDEKLIRAIRERAYYFIQKPFDREVLKTLVERCLELRWYREENRPHLQRMESELTEARAFQQGLLPAREAVIDGVAVCRYAPCSEEGATSTIMRWTARGTRRCSLPMFPDTAPPLRC